MSLLIKTAFHNAIAEGIYNEIQYKIGRYYYYLGKTLAWNVDDEPESPVDSYSYELDTRNNIIFTKLISGSDVSLVANRINWVSGNVYDMYDDIISVSSPAQSGATKLEDAQFYVLTSQYNVYKCIDNNLNSPSTVMPTDLSDEVFEYADGYKWKFMYSIPPAMRNKFLTNSHMPVFTALTNQFYANGEITTITIDNGGTGYTTASLTVSGDGWIEDNPAQIVSVTVTEPGDGYTLAPTVTIEAPHIISGSELQATATATLSGNTVGSIAIVEDGYGYNSVVSITIDPPFVGTEYQINTAYTNGVYVYYNDVFYQVVGTGNSGSTPPSHTAGTEVNGGISLTYVGMQAYAIVNTAKTEAQVTAVLSGGEIVGYNIVDGGIGYTTASITVTGDGTNAVLTPNFNIGNINTLQSNVELLAVDGALEAIVVTDGGDNYGSATVIITGDGTGATAEVVISSGQVSKINITNPGSGYTWADIAISGNGTGAIARAIISPIGGHGKNAIDELFARTLTFYTTISTEKNQGLSTDNDYRQTGIIKQINGYGVNTKYRGLTGSACFRIYATLNAVDFPNDTIVYNVATNKQYLVIDSITNSLLLLPMDGEEPSIGNSYRNDSMVTFTITDIDQPQINPSSGDLLFIDNRNGFIPSSEQNVVIRTVVGF